MVKGWTNLVCQQCGKPRSYGSGKICRSCYRLSDEVRNLGAKESEAFRKEFLDWLDDPHAKPSLPNIEYE